MITIENHCSSAITAFTRQGSSATSSYQLAASTGSQDLDVGTLVTSAAAGADRVLGVWFLVRLSEMLLGKLSCKCRLKLANWTHMGKSQRQHQ